jgi:hypothetical protein
MGVSSFSRPVPRDTPPTGGECRKTDILFCLLRFVYLDLTETIFLDSDTQAVHNNGDKAVVTPGKGCPIGGEAFRLERNCPRAGLCLYCLRRRAKLCRCLS